MFDVCELHTRILGWGDRWWYLETRFVRGNETVATVIAKAMVRDANGSVAPERLGDLLGIRHDRIRVPEHIQRWADAEALAH